jgi:hypothetical protein
MDMTPLLMGSLISNTLETLVDKGVISKQEAADVFLKTGAELRQTAASVSPTGGEQWVGMASLIEMLANKFVRGSYKGPASN